MHTNLVLYAEKQTINYRMCKKPIEFLEKNKIKVQEHELEEVMRAQQQRWTKKKKEEEIMKKKNHMD